MKQQKATGMYHSYANEVNGYASLTDQEEQDLWVRVEKGDETARGSIIKASLKKVIGLSWKYANDKVSIDDLISESKLTLMKASQKYDRTKGVRFHAFACPEVKGAIINMVKNAAKQRVSENIDIDCLEDNDANAFYADDDVSWLDNLPHRIQDYLDQRYYPGVGRVFINTMLLTTDGFSLKEAAAKLGVMPEFVKTMKREVYSRFNNCKRLAVC